MDAVELDQTAREVDALVEALDEERARHVAGLTAEPALAAIFAERPRVAHRDTIVALREGGRADLGDRVSGLRAERACASAEDAWRAADASAAGLGPQGKEPVVALELALPRERDPVRRADLARAAAEGLAPAASAGEAYVEARARARAENGLAPDWQAVVAGDEVLSASDDAWRDVLAFTLRRDLGAGRGERRDVSRADLLHVLALARWDGLFRAGMLPVALRLTSERLGLDLGAVPVDDAERAAKWPGAHAVGTRVSFRPRGGAGDWQDLLAAVGRARAAAAARPHARDAVLAEALAFALGSLLLEPRWLAERADVERRHAADVVRDLALRRVFVLRADAAALRVASEVERGLSGAAWRTAYAEALTAATRVTWERERAARDGDAARLATRIRGAAAGERLRLALRERFDEDWWRNPRTAAHLGALLAAGRLPPDEAPPSAAEGVRALVARLEGR